MGGPDLYNARYFGVPPQRNKRFALMELILYRGKKKKNQEKAQGGPQKGQDRRNQMAMALG